VGNIRGKGLFWALEFVSDRSSKEPFATCLGFGVGVQKAAFEMGLAVYPGIGTADGSRGDHVLLAPPYTMTDEELEVLVHTLRAAYDREEARVFGAE
jgi:adenosylmethionine-8-amino-7-oxononanoate aminotransferase